jgi:ubiquinone/menaquinone biosynthesis C-methylase UbiE
MKNDAFISKAADWDSPDKISMTDKFVTELLAHINPLPGWKALELGAGTGLVGLQLEPLIGNIVMVDTSESMLEVLKQKLNNNRNVEVLHGEVFDYKQQDIDLVFSAMAFHHLTDIEKAIQHLATITRTGAWVVVGDLVTEDGSFHRFEPIPHRGFDTSVLSGQFTSAGFEVTQVKVYNTLSRTSESGTKNYNQFMLIAKRR